VRRRAGRSPEGWRFLRPFDRDGPGSAVVAVKFRGSMHWLSVCRRVAGAGASLPGLPPAGRGACVFFVSVNQVLVRLWACRMEGRVQPIVRPTGREAGGSVESDRQAGAILAARRVWRMRSEACADRLRLMRPRAVRDVCC
jgi:hypothetical protein